MGDVLLLSPADSRFNITRVDLAFANSGARWRGDVTLRLYDGEPFNGTPIAFSGSFPVDLAAGNSIQTFNLSWTGSVGHQVTVTIQGIGPGVSFRWFDPPSVGTSGDYFVIRDPNGAGTGWSGLYFGGSPNVANIYAKVWATPVAPTPHYVRVIYLSPLDRTAEDCDTIGMSAALRSLQAWYQGQMGNGKTFSIAPLGVTLIRTPHTAAWYSTNPNGDAPYWFWNNALDEAFALGGARFNDPDNRWMIYIEADPACGPIIGGTAGVALLGANDVRGLTGRTNVPPCPGQPPDSGGPCRWTGGLGHELGHALGLPHPLGCEDNDPGTPCPSQALMWLGFATYPAASLTPEDRAALNASPFFTVQPALPMPHECAAMPTVFDPPASMAVPAGRDVSFSIGAASAASGHSYRWRRNFVDLDDDGRISGTRAATLVVRSVSAADSGVYDVRIVNDCGMVISPSATLTVRCPADVDDGSGTNHPDGGVTLEDLLYFLGRYSLGDLRADVDNGSGTGTPDGGVGIEDLLYFLSRYGMGC